MFLLTHDIDNDIICIQITFCLKRLFLKLFFLSYKYATAISGKLLMIDLCDINGQTQ